MRLCIIKMIMYRITASSAMLDAESNVALIIHTRRIRELVRLEVYPGLRLVLVVRKLSHDLAIDWTTANKRIDQIKRKNRWTDYFISHVAIFHRTLYLKKHFFVLSEILSISRTASTYPSSFISRCSPHPRPSRTRQSEIFRPNISCLSMLMTRVKGSPIFTFSATWCCVGSPLKIFIVHPGIGAVACVGRKSQFKYTYFTLIHYTFIYIRLSRYLYGDIYVEINTSRIL